MDTSIFSNPAKKVKVTKKLKRPQKETNNGSHIVYSSDTDDEVQKILTTPPSSPKKKQTLGSPVKRSNIRAEPVLPYSTENVLVTEITNILYQTISLEQNMATNELVSQNFSLVLSKIDAIMLRSLHSTPTMLLEEFKDQLLELPVTGQVKTIIENVLMDHWNNLNADSSVISEKPEG